MKTKIAKIQIQKLKQAIVKTLTLVVDVVVTKKEKPLRFNLIGDLAE